LSELPLAEVDRLEMNQLLAQWALWDDQIAEIDAKIQERQLPSRRIHEGMDWGAAAGKRSAARNLARTDRDIEA